MFVARSELRSFWLPVSLLFAVLAVALYAPVFAGRFPVPGMLVTQFSPWLENSEYVTSQHVADIGDLVDYFYPVHSLSSSEIAQGRFPQWNPYIMGGVPLQEEPQSALFYPLHVLYYVFSAPVAWTLMLILRIWLAAMFMTALMRAIDVSRIGSVISGMAFAFGGFCIAWQGSALGDAMIWLPLVCYSTLHLSRHPSRQWVAITAIAFAMPVLAGHPETAIHVILTGCAAALFLWIFPEDGRSRFNMPFPSSFAAAGVLAVGLAAVQFVPTLDWIGNGSRTLNDLWPTFDWHQGLGFVSRDITRGPNSAAILVPNAVSYVGMFTLLAGGQALLSKPRRYVLGFACLVVFGVGASFGVAPFHWLLSQIPVVRGLKNDRLILLSDFGLAALAGIGVSYLQSQGSNYQLLRQRLVRIGVMLTATSLAVGLFIYKLYAATVQRADFFQRPSFSRAMLLAGIVLVGWKMVRGERFRAFGWAAAALTTFDLLTFGFGFTGFVRRDQIFPPAPVFDFLQKQDRPGTFRIAPGAVCVYAANTPMAYGLESVTGYEVTVPPRLRLLTADIAENLEPYISLISEKVLESKDRRLDLLNMKYLVVPTPRPEYKMYAARPERFLEVFNQGGMAVFENRNVLPRAFVVSAHNVRLLPDAAAQVEMLKDPAFNPLQAVILEQQPEEFQNLRAIGEAEPPFAGNVSIIGWEPDGYRFQVHASTPAVLVVSQNYFPGWRATMEGRSLSVFPADEAITGIAVPSGDHTVDLVYGPKSFRWGAVLSLIAVGVLAVLLKKPLQGSHGTPEKSAAGRHM